MENFREDSARSSAQTILRPVIGLTESLPKVILETIVVEAMRKHHFLRDVAEMRHEESQQFDGSDCPVNPARAAYIRAMIDVHAQQTVLSTLLDVLGYIPELPAN